jgi:hypothetical protein
MVRTQIMIADSSEGALNHSLVDSGRSETEGEELSKAGGGSILNTEEFNSKAMRRLSVCDITSMTQPVTRCRRTYEVAH